MNRKELLRGNSENAQMSFLLEDVFEEKGEALWEENERLKADPDAAVPKAALDRALRVVQKDRRRQKMRQGIHQVTRRAASIALVLVGIGTLATGVVAASEPLRTAVRNLVIEVFDDYTDFYVEGAEASEDTPVSLEITPGWIPEGFYLKEKSVDFFECSYWYEKQDNWYEPYNSYFWISCTVTDGTGIRVNSEDAEEQIIDINGNEAHFYITQNQQTGGDVFQVIWPASDNTVFITVCGEGDLTKEDILRIAEDLTYQENEGA